ncbi:hypothetical protein [Haloarcula sp. CBA1122]|uniref:hypothetical protein n=1 Tax=Haloarcula sp. CBA1122 TaxID=2668069 RepID=UPI001309F85E|nr:hypothetical protein [Haloarcula sp. CBA1122]MUV49108.1 hypothetical protein [Haloarcula sp. CBA1122]
MNDNIESFASQYTEVVTDCERFAYLPRDIDRQKESIKKLTELLESSVEVHKSVIAEKDEEAANQLLVFRCMADSIRYNLKMWIDLKREDWEKAWDALVDAQEKAKSARAAHDISKDCNVDSYLERLENIETNIFPPQNFNSPELIISKFSCSLCKQDYSECGHIAGKPYWGVFCQKVPEEIVKMRAAALVDNPKDKKARMTEHVTDDGMVRDQMTWEKREMDEDEAERYNDRSDEDFITQGVLMTASDNSGDFSNYMPD